MDETASKSQPADVYPSSAGADELRILAQLVGLVINDEERGSLQTELEQFIEYFACMERADVEAVPLGTALRAHYEQLRHDQPHPESADMVDALLAAAETDAGSILIPNVL